MFSSAEEFGLTISTIGLILFALRVQAGRVALNRSFVQFGGGKVQLSPDERETLLRSCLRQQQVAFGVLMGSVILGMLFTSALLYEAIQRSGSNTGVVRDVVGLGLDSAVGGFAKYAYNSASRRLDGLVRSLGQP